MSEQLQFLQTDRLEVKDPIVEEVERLCKEAAPKCARILIQMAFGEVEFEPAQRVACLDTIAIAFGKRFLAGGKQAKEKDKKEELSYSTLMNALREPEATKERNVTKDN